MFAEGLQRPLAQEAAGLPQGWQRLLAPSFQAPSWHSLCAFVDSRVDAGAQVYPHQPFAALHATPPEAVHVVILGQDPYHGPGQAHGFAFSVPPGVKPPPSLRNIFAELGVARTSGNLESWAAQGVLLLNSVLTVEAALPASHAKKGWEALTDDLLRSLGAGSRPCAFLLWGAYAQAKAALLGPQHLVLSANHPSPLSARRLPAPFIGCGHFARVNQWLAEQGQSPVRW